MYDLFNTGENRRSNMELVVFFPMAKTSLLKEEKEHLKEEVGQAKRGSGQTWFKL